MNDTPFLSLIVPVYDEQDNLRHLHNAIVDALAEQTFEVIYVNDGSRDSSAEVLDRLQRRSARACHSLCCETMDKLPH